MELSLPDRVVHCFSVIYRDDSVQQHHYHELIDFIQTAEAHDHTGMLLFESNRGNVEPWVVGQELLGNTKKMIPFIAVNPVYMHPFIVAKRVLALSNFHQRRVFLNFITGTSKTDLINLSDSLSHDDRYDRLSEYIQIINHLLTETRPLNFEGAYYQVKNLMLSSQLPKELHPRFFVAGASDKAEQIRKETGACRTSMGKDVAEWQDTSLMDNEQRGVHFGIIARSTQEEANAALDAWLEGTEGAETLFDASMSNTDGQWKKNLASAEEVVSGAFNLKPMKRLKSDCPYYVGTYEDCARVMVRYILNGFDTLIPEVAVAPQEFEHIQKVFQLTEEIMRKEYYAKKEVPAMDFSF
ncbi:MAG: LLM class flavin-dependent oxidoreductase [Bacteroidota bacterium]